MPACTAGERLLCPPSKRICPSSSVRRDWIARVRRGPLSPRARHPRTTPMMAVSRGRPGGASSIVALK